ncbi:MerR family transcriptional regulator [Brenneria sp. 4F2]|nr:MerR family transcriptional regulator [Brenneria bubanii]
MKIGELAKRAGVSVRMLRYYEQAGLLTPYRRASGYREFSAADEKTVERIRTLSEAGLTLATIRRVMPCMDEQGSTFKPCPQVRPALLAELEKIGRKLDALTQSRDILAGYLQPLD